MRRKSELYILGLFLLIGFSSCWKEDLKNCWMGDVTFHVMAECFQELPGGRTEENLGVRINSIHYYLYKGDELYQQGTVEGKSALDAQKLTLTFPKLPFGDYSLSVFGNVDGQGGIVYPGAADTEDYFVSGYPFTIDCDCNFEDIVVLYRSQGVSQFELKNLPDNIAEIEVSINKLSLICLADTIYQGETKVVHRVPVSHARADGLSSVLIGSFPTVADTDSEVILRLFAKGDPNFLVYEKKVAKGVIIRNQLLRIAADFNHSIDQDVAFTVTVNPEWDGVNGGGDIPVE